MNSAKLSESKTYFKAEMVYLYISTVSMKSVTKDFKFQCYEIKHKYDVYIPPKH